MQSSVRLRATAALLSPTLALIVIAGPMTYSATLYFISKLLLLAPHLLWKFAQRANGMKWNIILNIFTSETELIQALVWVSKTEVMKYTHPLSQSYITVIYQYILSA